MRRISNFLFGAFLGATFGAILALLLTPYSGERLLEQVNSRFDNLRAEMNNAYRTRRAQLEAELAAMREGQPAE